VSYFFSGLDLGQMADFSALAVLERSAPDPPPPGRNGAGRPPWSYAVRLLRRWPLRTPYHAIAADVADLFARPPLTGSVLAIDATGVGRAVVEVIGAAKPACRRSPVVITAGHRAALEPDGWHVPKKELVSALQVVLQGRRLRVAKLPERAVLLRELESFRVKITAAANETFEAWRERDHDDLVLAVSLAVWLGERTSPPSAARPSVYHPRGTPGRPTGWLSSASPPRP
jgi:hypothetical protein